MFVFTPLSEEELNNNKNRGLLEDGIYDFIIKSVEQRTSSTGFAMLLVHFSIISPTGVEYVLKDYISSNPKTIFKVKAFLCAIGLEDAYNAGTFDPQICVNRSGKAKIGVEKGKPMEKDPTRNFDDRNIIKGYIKSVSSAPADPELNDDVPF